ncbi:MAG TPA: polysaccharide deacetylase family protein [Gemmatimonadales bacterium]|nr:polysaccharide deacetylase family protein [Gemmatimonadales bacterium]
MSPDLRTVRHSATRLLRTHYPRFLFGIPGPSPSCPVFCYHEVDPEVFAGDLRFLAENGYRTLSTCEFFEAVSSAGGERAVLLTFDDAKRNFWEVTFPLLQQFGARATLFAPTAWIEGGDRNAEPETEAPAGTFMTWDQLRTCARSGLVDVQAHGHRHALVHISPRLVGFATPALVKLHHIYDWPMRHESGRNRLGVPPLGNPVYQAEPLLSARLRIVEDEGPARACRDLVERMGGEAFFRQPGALARLRRVHAEAIREGSRARRVEGSEFEALVRAEFERSSELLRHHLGTAPEFFAYPWMLGSDLSLRLAAEAGVKAVFGVGFDFRRTRRLAGPVPGFGRLKGDWLRFLPGRGRRRLREVVPEKLKGFLLSQHLAH